MPVYDWNCNACGQRFERYARMSAQTVACPACRSRRTSRVPSAPTLLTDTNMSAEYDRAGQLAGVPLRTRADLRAVENKGWGFVNQRDQDIYDRRRSRHVPDMIAMVKDELTRPIASLTTKRTPAKAARRKRTPAATAHA